MCVCVCVCVCIRIMDTRNLLLKFYVFYTIFIRQCYKSGQSRGPYSVKSSHVIRC